MRLGSIPESKGTPAITHPLQGLSRGQAAPPWACDNGDPWPNGDKQVDTVSQAQPGLSKKCLCPVPRRGHYGLRVLRPQGPMEDQLGIGTAGELDWEVETARSRREPRPRPPSSLFLLPPPTPELRGPMGAASRPPSPPSPSLWPSCLLALSALGDVLAIHDWAPMQVLGFDG